MWGLTLFHIIYLFETPWRDKSQKIYVIKKLKKIIINKKIKVMDTTKNRNKTFPTKAQYRVWMIIAGLGPGPWRPRWRHRPLRQAAPIDEAALPATAAWQRRHVFDLRDAHRAVTVRGGEGMKMAMNRTHCTALHYFFLYRTGISMGWLEYGVIFFRALCNAVCLLAPEWTRRHPLMYDHDPLSPLP